MLLLFDNHESIINIKIIKMVIENGIIIVNDVNINDVMLRLFKYVTAGEKGRAKFS